MKLKDTDKILEELTKIKDKKRKDNAEAFVNNQLDISYWLNAQATQLEDVIRLIEKAPTEEPFCPYLSDEEVKQPCLQGPCEITSGADMRKGDERYENHN